MERQKRINELNREIQQNAEDYYNGSLSYEELHAIQYNLIKERNGLLQN